ncbi:BglG family transcription antiterminator [Bacillus swezeyi]|uniref:BglG family transcription antiterminator n=1 Tax=Bacillus swezeyi TaxID=1925020 RepID=UPI002E21F914|nr:BglG family transcription antiterminator [Bacillus swezeyi]
MITEKRPANLLQYLVRVKEATMHQLIDHFQLTKRQIYYDFEKINHWLAGNKLPQIEYKRKNTVVVPEEVLQLTRNRTGADGKYSFIFTQEERIKALYIFLFIRREPISSAHLTQLLQVSKNTVMNDVKKANEALHPFLVAVGYTRHQGYHLKGSEFDKRVPVMHYLSSFLRKPYGKKMLRYILKTSGASGGTEGIKTAIDSISEEFHLQFVEERLNEFIHFLKLYSLRVAEGKVIQLHQEEKEMLKQNPLRFAAEKLLEKLYIPTYETEVCYVMIQILGLSFGSRSADDPLFQMCEKLVLEFESRACITFSKRNEVAESLYRHIKPAYFRMKYRIPIHNPLLNKIKKDHKELYTIVQKLVQPLESCLNIPIPEEEIGFITIHFCAMLEKPIQTNSFKKTAVVICPGGVSSSLMVKRQLESLFSEICVEKTLSLQEYTPELFDQYDAVFSTIELKTERHYYIAEPLMTPAEKSRLVNEVYQNLFGIKQREILTEEFIELLNKHVRIIDEKGLRDSLKDIVFLQKATEIRRKRPVLKELLTDETIQMADQITGWEEAIKKAAKPLLDKEVIQEEYTDAMIDNVKTMGPYMIIGPEIAIPHARPEMGVNKVGMSLLKLKKPVYFLDDKQYPVKLLFCIAAVDQTTHLKALSQLTRLLSNKDNQNVLKETESMERVRDLIKAYSSY